MNAIQPFSSTTMADILAFGAHPDDVELGAAGTLLAATSEGKRCVVADLTRGELGTRGTVATRDAEAAAASRILGLADRVNLGLPDGFFSVDRDSILAVVRVIRAFRPEIVLAPSRQDRHPDHGRAGRLITEACFLSGLSRVQSSADTGEEQEPWRPKSVYQYIQDRLEIPDIIVDITAWQDKKLEAILAFRSQFYDPKSEEPGTYISSPEFLEGITSRARETGRMAGFRYGEGFTVQRVPGVRSLFDLK